MNTQKFDAAIVGGGILGLAHASWMAENGKSVIIFEREPKAYGASIRNFGLVWPIGQPTGPLYDRAMRGRERWLDLSKKADFWCNPNGSLHLAYREDELAVIEEYAQKFGQHCEIKTPAQLAEENPFVQQQGLLGGLYSRTEMTVNPTRAIHALSGWLQHFGNVKQHFGEEVRHVEKGRIETSKASYEAEQIFICGGDEFQTLYPEVFEESPLIKSKLQMMRSYPLKMYKQFGPTLCGGLTLQHYASFAQCESLPELKKRYESEMKEYLSWGIHVMVTQNELGELVIGDSHEYGFGFDPFNRGNVNELILKYLNTFMNLDYQIGEHWYGVYAKNPESTEFMAEPDEGVKIVTGVGGAGMTLSFGLAQENLGLA
jgi:FAD dependent oxidoreductase TIGR03364